MVPWDPSNSCGQRRFKNLTMQARREPESGLRNTAPVLVEALQG